MTTAKSLPLNLAYEGSVKRVWQSTAEADKLFFQFTDDYSVFDWGKMPDTIANKGRALTLMGAFFFEELGKASFWQELKSSPHLQKFSQSFLDARFKHETYSGSHGLAKQGLAHHFEGLTDDTGKVLSIDQAIASSGNLFMKVKKAIVYRPADSKVLNHNLFFYPAHSSGSQIRLVPLEIVFRFGMPAGSSLQERLQGDSSYAKALGFDKMPESNQWFKQPIIEFFTKLEPKDRFLSYQEAALLSGLNAQTFEQLTEIAMDTALALHAIFGQHGMELWDGKIEVLQAIDETNNTSTILLADSVGPDELRVLLDGHQLSKEMLRQFYRGGNWEKSIKESQKFAKERATLDWKTICQKELKADPEPLPKPFKAQVDKLYCVLANTLMQKKAFADCGTLPQFIEQTNAVLEIAGKKK